MIQELTKTLSKLKSEACLVPCERITWDDEDAYNVDTDKQMLASDFNWYAMSFPLASIGDADFYEYLGDWAFEQLSLDESAKIDENSQEAVWAMIEAGLDIHTPVELALAYQPYYEEERLHIADGWHRIGLYIKAGRTEIPALVGFPKS